MKFELDKIARKSLARVKPYSTARDEFKGVASVFLDANENPFPSDFNRYPDPNQEKLKLAIAKLKEIAVDQILLGNGSDEVIDLLFRALCEPGIDNVVIPQPTYGMYSVCATINDIEIRQPQLTTDFQLDLSAINKEIDSHTKLIFLCSPNNPSGNLLLQKDILQLLESFNGLIIVDEAYIDFSDSAGLLTQLNKFPNLVVLQTFSKAWGLAGLRLGVGYASPEVIGLLQRIKPPYNISSLTQIIALAALENTSIKNEQVESITKEREYMEDKLGRFSFVDKVYPSDANFILTQVNDAQQCYDHLLQQGIIVRNRSSVVKCDNCLRITIGTKEENIKLIEALTQYEKSIIY